MTFDYAKYITIRLRVVRQNLGLTQKDFAEKTGLNLRTLISYEKGDTVPRGKYMAKAKEALDWAEEELKANLERAEGASPDITALPSDTPPSRSFLGHVLARAIAPPEQFKLLLTEFEAWVLRITAREPYAEILIEEKLIELRNQVEEHLKNLKHNE